jgi:predicted DNA-binding helix-hairpin-helix protein
MDGIDRLKLLTAQMHLEPAEDAHCPELTPRKRDSVFVSPAVLPNGKRISLLKTQLTSACERNCYYCPFRAGRDFRRATFTPDEFGQTFMALHKARVAEGLFVSSGVINGGVTSQDKLIDTAEILRRKLGYRGYLHLKLMPGVERAQVERAMQLADRVSLNLEAPNSHRLMQLAPLKHFTEELLQPLRWVEEIRQTQPGYLGWNNRWPSSVTQFVVGAVGDTDLELLSTTQELYRQFRIKRAYYSAFHPIEDTPLENLPPTSPLREARLYEASFLIRDYGFDLEELPFDKSGNLPLNTDPKLAWARDNLSSQPVEINRADRRELLRIPGIGLKSANAIITARRQNRLHDLEALHSLGINAKRAAPFILLDGRRPAHQTTFW